MITVQMGEQQRGELAAPTPTAAARIKTPRPQSTRKNCSPARTRVDGPARLASTIGLPVPSRVTSIMCACIPSGAAANSGCRLRPIHGLRTPSRDRRTDGPTPRAPAASSAVNCVGIQCHRQRGEVLLDPSGAPRPGDGHRSHSERNGPVAQPRERDLCRGGFQLPRRTAADHVDHREVGLQCTVREPGEPAAEVRPSRQIRSGTDGAGEESTAQGRVRHEADGEFDRGGYHAAFDVAAPDRPLALHRGDRDVLQQRPAVRRQ